MKIFVCERNLIENYFAPEKDECMHYFLSCLPRDDSGQYHVSRDGSKFITVPREGVWDYPLIKVNWYDEEEETGDPDEYYDASYDIRGYKGINESGVSLLAINIRANPDEYEKHLGLSPSYISIWKDRLQILFRLENFIPRLASKGTWSNLGSTISKLEGHLGGVYTDEVVNPFCGEVRTYIYNIWGTNLRWLNKIDRKWASPEHIKEVRGKGGKLACEMRADKSKESILKAVMRLIEEGRPLNQTVVAKMCGLSRKTVNKHWAEIVNPLFADRDML